MSRLPTTSTIPTPTRRLVRQPSAADLRKRKTISENVPPMPKSSKSTTTTKARSRSFVADRTIITSPKPTKRSSNQLFIGDRVAVDSMGIIGTLKFMGETEFKDGLWAGIQLDFIGSGKNDGSVNGIRYFSCPPQSGLFVLASKVSSLNQDSDSVRSLSPPNSTKLSLVTKPRQNTTSTTTTTKRKSRTPNTIVRSPTSSLNTPLTSPVSSSSRHSVLKQPPSYYHQNIHSPTPTQPYRNLPSPAITPQQQAEDYHDIMETPIPDALTASKSQQEESAHERLERVLGEAINQAPDEQVMKLQQLQLRVEVLEAENKYLKLENTQNKTAEQIIERSLILKKSDTNDQEMFTLEGHKAILKEIKDQHEQEVKSLTEQSSQYKQIVQRLETKVQDLEADQINSTTEKDRVLFEFSSLKKEKSTIEHTLHELETKIADLESNISAAQAKEKLLLEKTKSLQDQLKQEQHYYVPHDQSDMMDRQMKLELELEEMHEKMNSVRESTRAKDMFLTSLSEQVEIHRNAVEEKEREIRRMKADHDRALREKEHVLQELKELEQKWLNHQDCTPKEGYDKLKKEHALLKEKSSQRIDELENSLQELQRAGVESIEIYENTLELRKLDIEALKESLADARRKIASLTDECSELENAGLEAIKVYEDAIQELKNQKSLEHQEHEKQRESLQQTISDLEKQIKRLMENVESEEKQRIMLEVKENEHKRLLEQIKSLEQEKASFEAFKQEAEVWKEQTKENEKLIKEKSKLEEQLGRLQSDYNEQLQVRNKHLEDMKVSVENQKKTESELRKTKERLEKELKRTDASPIEIETFRSEIEKLQAQNDMLIKQKEQLYVENKNLKGLNKQNEIESFKLMDEVEKLHQQILLQEQLANSDLSEQDKISLLTKENQTKLDAEQKKLLDKEKEYKMKIQALNREVSDLESLIEDKVFREADLEEALEKERKQIQRLKAELLDLKQDKQESINTNTNTNTNTESTSNSNHVDSVYCEICEAHGHDTISCKAVKMPNNQPERPYCENCEEYGLHFTNKCPNQNETF